MIFSVVYPNSNTATFDADYYAATHAPLVQEIWNPDRIDLVQGLPGPDGSPPPFCLIAHIHFASAEAFGAALAHPRGGELAADVANFTDITPIAFGSRALG